MVPYPYCLYTWGQSLYYIIQTSSDPNLWQAQDSRIDLHWVHTLLLKLRHHLLSHRHEGSAAEVGHLFNLEWNNAQHHGIRTRNTIHVCLYVVCLFVIVIVIVRSFVRSLVCLFLCLFSCLLACLFVCACPFVVISTIWEGGREGAMPSPQWH